MSEINFNQELFKAAMNCKDAKEVLNFAKSKGITMTEEQAGNLFAFAHKGKLTDEEMDQIVGGQLPITFKTQAAVLATAGLAALLPGVEPDVKAR